MPTIVVVLLVALLQGVSLEVVVLQVLLLLQAVLLEVAILLAEAVVRCS